MTERQRHPDEPPFTLEEAEDWLAHNEGIATAARDSVTATRVLVGTLLLALTERGVIDKRAFITNLRAQLPRLDAPTALATEQLLRELELQDPAPAAAPEPGAPGTRLN